MARIEDCYPHGVEPLRACPDTADQLVYLAHVARCYTTAVDELFTAASNEEHVVAMTKLARAYLTTKDDVAQIVGALIAKTAEGG